MISASHNSAEYNGIKMFSGDGYKLPDVFIVVAKQNPVEQEGTYLLAEAQQDINRLLKDSKSNYQVTKLLGVGTIAESYLAKDSSGKEVCIKILKKGIRGALRNGGENGRKDKDHQKERQGS